MRVIRHDRARLGAIVARQWPFCSRFKHSLSRVELRMQLPALQMKSKAHPGGNDFQQAELSEGRTFLCLRVISAHGL